MNKKLCALALLLSATTLCAADNASKINALQIAPAYTGKEIPPRAVTTMRSIGLYWKPASGSTENRCRVRYRKAGTEIWRQAIDMWFDFNPHKGAEEHTSEYRGSIVHLKPDTAYEVELSIDSLGLKRILQAKTMPEEFKIARTITVPEAVDKTYIINEGGSSENGYVLYAPAAGTKPVWDAADKIPVQVQVNASYVIVRGLTLKNAKIHGIELKDVNHVVIEDCDISGWGQNDPRDNYGVNFHSALYSKSEELQSIVVRNNLLHHPRSDSNSWREKNSESYHPRGAQGISLMFGKGHYIIYNNKIYSDLDHMFNDSMGSYKNFSYNGFPNRDSDIYGNFVSHCWDDGLEIEGADMNVRVWHNYIDTTWGAIGAAAPSLGPVYFWRNVYATSRAGRTTDASGYRGHYTFKLGNENPEYVRGKMYIFHNTALQPAPYAGHSAPSGAQSGIVFTSEKKLAHNITSRNNILHLRINREWAVRDTQNTPDNDFDHDMHNGKITGRKGTEKSAIVAEPEYERAPDGRLWLKPGTSGHDAAMRIPNFNDEYTGKAPDMGAVETGSKLAKPQTWPDFPQTFKAVDKDEISLPQTTDKIISEHIPAK